MSDIVIRGMEMPECCIRCRFETSSIYGQLCRITGKHSRIDGNENGSRRHTDCPLVELPPHGRLIDADEAKDTMMIEMCGTGCQSRACHVLDSDFYTPTILEASKE